MDVNFGKKNLEIRKSYIFLHFAFLWKQIEELNIAL